MIWVCVSKRHQVFRIAGFPDCANQCNNGITIGWQTSQTKTNAVVGPVAGQRSKKVIQLHNQKKKKNIFFQVF